MSSFEPTPAWDPRALVGSTLDGRYLLGTHLATGGMGAVFRATHVYMRKDVAIKVLRPDLTTSPEIVERFRREAEIAASLDHPNIVRVSDFGRSPEGYLFLVMELLHGESLFDRLRREGTLPPEEVVPILVEVCHALEAAHAQNVVHRDLKPENVFLARNGRGGETARILDFGIAKIADAANTSTTQAGMVVGTPEYLAPEQALGAAVDGRADIYAVGLIAWRALVGRHPFKADDARGLLMMQATRPVPSIVEGRPELAEWPALAAVIARACAKDVSERHQTAAALAADLEAALGPAYVAPATPTPLPPRTPAPRPSSRFTPLLPGLEAPAPEGSLTPVVVPLPPAAPADAGPGRLLARLPRRALTIAGSSAAIVLAIAVAVAMGREGDGGAQPTPEAAASARPASEQKVARRTEAAPEPAPESEAKPASKPVARTASIAGPKPVARTGARTSDAAALVPKLVADLQSPRCEVRRAAARRLGELGDPAALPKLRILATTPADPDGFHGLGPPELVCGAAEAEEAARKIELALKQAKTRDARAAAR